MGDNTEVVVFIDGACERNGCNDAKASYGVYWGKDNPNNISGLLPDKEHQTSNRGEMHAGLVVLQQAAGMKIKKLTIKSDSNYLVSGMNIWHKNWTSNNWTTSKGLPVLNKDKWLQLLEYSKGLEAEIVWEHVKSHSGVEGNEMADKLARGALELQGDVRDEDITKLKQVVDEPRKVQEVCGICGEESSDDTILCEDCGSWVHYLCTDLPLYQVSKLITSKRKFSCENCVAISEDIHVSMSQGVRKCSIKEDEVGATGIDEDVKEIREMSEDINSNQYQLMDTISKLEGKIVDQFVNQEKELEELKNCVENIKKEKENQRQSSSEMEKSLEKLRNELGNLKREVANAKRELENVQLDRDNKEKQKVKLQKENERLEKQIQNNETRLAEKEEIIRKLDKQCNDLTMQFIQVRSEINGTFADKVSTRKEHTEKQKENLIISHSNDDQSNDILVIGDSILRDVAASGLKPAPDINVIKKTAYTIEEAMDVLSNGEGRFRHIVAHIGTNDLKQEPSGNIVTKMLELVQEAKSKVGSEGKVVVSLPTPVNESAANNKIRKFNAELELNFIEDNNVILVKHLQETRGPPAHLLDSDGVHLNEEGTAKVAKSLKSALGEVTGRKPVWGSQRGRGTGRGAGRGWRSRSRDRSTSYRGRGERRGQWFRNY